MKRKHYLLSVEIGGVENYAVRNLACIVGYKLTTDESKAETFGESVKRRWLSQYPSGKAVEVSDEKRPDLEELRQIKKELHGPLKPRAVKFGPKPPPKFGPVKPRAVKFGPLKPAKSVEPQVEYGRGISTTFRSLSEAQNLRKKAREYWDSLDARKKENLIQRIDFLPDYMNDRALIRSNVGSPIANEVIEEVANLIRSSPEFLKFHAKQIERDKELDELMPRFMGVKPAEQPFDYEKEARDYQERQARMKREVEETTAAARARLEAQVRAESDEEARANLKSLPKRPHSGLEKIVRKEDMDRRTKEAAESKPKAVAARRAAEDAQRLEVLKNPIFVSMAEDTPRGYEPVSPTHVPGNLTREQLREWFLRNTGRLPIIPADVKDGVAWARARAVEAADEAFRMMMQTGGARVWAYFRPVTSSDARDYRKEAEDFWNSLLTRKKSKLAQVALNKDTLIFKSEVQKLQRAPRPGDNWTGNHLARLLELSTDFAAFEKERDAQAIRKAEEEVRKAHEGFHTDVSDPEGEQRLRNEKLRDFWFNWTGVANRKGTHEHILRANELHRRAKEFNALPASQRKKIEKEAPSAFLDFANGIKAQPYLANLPPDTILRIEGKPMKGFKNPTTFQFILLPEGTWRRLDLDGNNWRPYLPGGNTLSSVVGMLANSKPSEIHVIRPGTKEHDRYMDKAREYDDVTPAVLELLREYMTGSRRKDAPNGIIRKYKGSDFHLLARALSAKLVERADLNDKEAVRLTEKGKARLGGEVANPPKAREAKLKAASSPRVFVREDPSGKRNWKHYVVIEDGKVRVIEMTPALYGWNWGKITTQGIEAWKGMDANEIETYKRQSDPLFQLASTEKSHEVLEHLRSLGELV